MTIPLFQWKLQNVICVVDASCDNTSEAAAVILILYSEFQMNQFHVVKISSF